MNKIISVVKKIIFGLIVLYSFNLIMKNINVFIPINLYTIGTVSFLGFPGLFVLIGLVMII